MKDVLLSNAGVQVYIIDGSRRTDGAARAVITALYKAGRICKEAAERAWSDRATLDKIKRNMLHVQMEERETETGKRWTFYTAGFVYMDIPAYSRNYIRADKQGNLYPTEAPTEEETSTTGQDTTCTDTEPQEGTETAQKTTESREEIRPQEDTTTPETNAQRAAQSAEKTAGDTTPTAGDTEPQRATETPKKAIQTGERLYSHPHRHMVTVEGLQGDLVRVIYKGRLYLVCSNDLYTDETETTPAQMENDTTSATETTQEAPQTAGTSEGAETTTPPHTEPPRATDAAGGSVSQSDRSHPDRRKVTFSAWMYKTGSDPPKI